MIIIILDPYGLREDYSSDLVVRDESRFIESRLRIRGTLHKGKDLNVIIKNRKIWQWYRSQKDYSDVKMETISPSSVLSQALKLPVSLSLNLPVNDYEIQKLEMIKKAETHRSQTRLVTRKDIESWVLSVYIGKCWGEKGGTLTHLTEIASFFLRGEKYQRHSTLERLMDKQKEEWINSPIGEAYKWLFTASKDRSFLIYVWQILKDYDRTIREKILDEITEKNRKVLEPIKEYLEQIPPCECSENYRKKAELSNLLEIKWKQILRSRVEYKKGEIQAKKDEVLKQKFKKIINEEIMKMSGAIVGEIYALLAFVQENAFYFNKDLFNIIGATFNQDQFSKPIEELSQLIPRKFPSRPILNWDWNQMSKWVINEYFPYKKWSIQQKKRDRRIEEITEVYTDWLYRWYPEFKNELAPLIYGTWYRIKKYLEQGYQILWIIIDNLCWFYLEEIIKAFKKQGLFPSTEPTPYLSMLPSETRISKTSLVAGKLPNQLEINKYQKYKLLFEDFCKHNNIVSYRVIPDSEFKESKLGKHQVTCCIVNKLDVSSHGGFFDLEDEIKDFIERIAKYVRDFLPLDLVSKRFYLVISTDHGSCKIPPDIRGLKVPKGANIEEQHKRFVYIDSNYNLDENWYFLAKNRFGLMESIAIAKGYNFVGNKKPKGLIHGGMTPEETFVPHLEFFLQPLKVKALQCFHNSSPIPIGTRKHKVKLSIRNLNDYEVSKVTLYIPSISIKMNLGKIPAKDEVVTSIEMALPKEDVIVDRDNTVTLHGLYSFYCLGEQNHSKVDVKINIKKIIDVSETMEEFF